MGTMPMDWMGGPMMMIAVVLVWLLVIGGLVWVVGRWLRGRSPSDR